MCIPVPILMAKSGVEFFSLTEDELAQWKAVGGYQNAAWDPFKIEFAGSLAAFDKLVEAEDLAEDAHNALRQITLAAQQGRRLTEEILAFSGSDVEDHTDIDGSEGHR